MFHSGVGLTTSFLKKQVCPVWCGATDLQVASNITVPFLGQDLVPVTSVKDLGVTLDSNLTFNGHITSLTSSLLSTLVQINRVQHLFSKDALYIILNSLQLFYCSTVWSETAKENIHKLQLMQTFAGRILTTTKKFDHITPVLHELGWLTIEELLRLRDVTMIFKCLNGLVIIIIIIIIIIIVFIQSKDKNTYPKLQ